MKLLKILKEILGSHVFEMILFGIFYGITAVSPDMLKNPMIFYNYIGFIILNAIIQEMEKRDSDKEFQNRIDNLQRQIDELKKGTD